MKTIIRNENLAASISHLGAELNSLFGKSTNREYLWQANPEFWAKHAPVLFPIVGTLKNNSFSHHGQTYFLPRHGFARDMDFNLVANTENSATFSLRSNDETRKKYHFDFEFLISYNLANNQLEVSYTVINLSTVTMYYAVGGHPAFALPQPFSEYQLEFERDETLQCFVLENDLLSDHFLEILPDNRRLALNYELFKNDALILKNIQSKKISIIENGIPVLNFTFKDFQNFGIWTKENAPFICLEPWMGYSDLLTSSGELSKKEGIQNLAPKTEKKYTFFIEIL